MAFEYAEEEKGCPWLSWGVTGLVTLAVVLAVGLFVSFQHPPVPIGPQAALPKVNLPTKSSADAPAATSANRAAVPRTSAAPPVEHVAVAPPQLLLATHPASERTDVATPATPRVASPQPSEASSPRPSQPKPSPVKADPPAPAESHADPSPPVQAAFDVAKQAAYVKAIAGVRRAMAQRDLAAAKRLLKTAADKAQDDAQHAEVERLEIIQDHLEQFWDGIRKAVSAMQPTDEIALSESNRVAVIEASRTALAVQWEGRPRRYPIEAMPMELLSAVAKASFKLTPGTKLVVGSFLAVDAQGDRARARKLWREAIAGGEADGKLLMPELDVPMPKTR